MLPEVKAKEEEERKRAEEEKARLQELMKVRIFGVGKANTTQPWQKERQSRLPGAMLMPPCCALRPLSPRARLSAASMPCLFPRGQRLIRPRGRVSKGCLPRLPHSTAPPRYAVPAEQAGKLPKALEELIQEEEEEKADQEIQVCVCVSEVVVVAVVVCLCEVLVCGWGEGGWGGLGGWGGWLTRGEARGSGLCALSR